MREHEAMFLELLLDQGWAQRENHHWLLTDKGRQYLGHYRSVTFTRILHNTVGVALIYR